MKYVFLAASIWFAFYVVTTLNQLTDKVLELQQSVGNLNVEVFALSGGVSADTNKISVNINGRKVSIPACGENEDILIVDNQHVCVTGPNFTN